MARLSPPLSKAVVDVPDDLAQKYRDAGWVEAEQSKPRATRKSRSSDAENDDK